MKVILATVGCKLNQAETETLARQLTAAGHEVVPAGQAADAFILNTCTVTSRADARCRQLLRQAHRRHPGAVIVAIGCYAARAAAELAALEGVSLVLGNEAKADLPRRLGEATGPPGTTPRPHPATRTRSFVKIQDGCREGCAYCIVPAVRPGETSLHPDSVVREVARRQQEGYREVVLTGTRVGAYHHSGTDLAGLLRRLLAETGIPRLRLSSLQPHEVTPGLLALWQDRRLCPHFHLSLQSGSDSVLARMNRRYTTTGYEQAVAAIRATVPDVAITTDVITGFPGETDAEFEESFEFCRRLGFARIHVFPFSPRPGTPAARMRPQLPARVIRERTDRLLALAAASAADFRARFSGRTMDVLWEKRTRDGRWSGTTGNYLRVYTTSAGDLASRLTPLRLP